MPVLKEYAESNSKDGYFVHAPISGQSHPIPLQAPGITEDIYRKLGYKPTEKGPEGGVNVPNELTWTLYEVGLHWTEKSGPKESPTDLDPETLREEAGPKLTEMDIETILSFSEEYQGQYKSQVQSLETELEAGVDNESTEAESEIENIIQEFVETMSEDSLFDDETEELVEQWEPENVRADDYEPEGVITNPLLTTYRTEYREKLASVPDLKDRLQELSSQVYQTESVEAVTVDSDDDNRALGIDFDVEDVDELDSLSGVDYRGTGHTYDFRISISVEDRYYTFEVVDSYISDFSIRVSSESVGKFELPPDDYWGYQVEQQNPDEIMHTLISDFANLIPLVENFFIGLSYELKSTDLGEHSVYLP